MKYFSFNTFLLILLFSFTTISYAQERTVTGSVIVFDSIALVNAEVKVLSSKVTVLTDTVGGFKINCLPNDKIKVSAKGFYSQKIKIDEKANEVFINMIFKPGEKNFDVAMGYGHIKEKDKSYAMTNIRNDDNFKFSKYSNMLDLIVNSSPSILNSNGQIIIRGSNSLNGSSAALIVIDGMDASMSQLLALSTMDVRSVDVLKGSSAAIYGSRGANGAVIITTKRGGDEVKNSSY
ncbi:TonB-dependent receptor plug domain-containing protein [uncultured Lutibacter sp.]|uniref:TonB-dependent receptor plug domain-containing protein n=1 Tax=uncultured Lutibacter sp. TaxID=437739 RepID=UPI00262C8B00|nr:TonB-dependent receptor plug domain-containing protein [uncultured Lutibacter sp.]